MSTPAPALTADDRLLLGEFKHYLDAAKELREKSDANSAEKLAAINTQLADIGTRVADLSQKQGERIDAAEEQIRVLKQRGLLNPPGSTPEGSNLSFGSRMVNLPQWKGLTFDGRFKHQITVPGRIFDRKAAGTITEAGSGYPIIAQRVGMYSVPNYLPLVMRDLVQVIPLSGTNAIEYVKETWEYLADYQVAEGDRKAQGNVTYTDETALVRTIAWFVKISRQMVADVPAIAATIDSKLIYGVMKKEEKEILWGDNAAGHLWGIMPQATILPADVLVDATGNIDMISEAVAYLAAQGFAASAVVMNGLAWGNMQIAKNSQGAYLLGGPPVADAQPRIWGLPIVTTPEMTGNQFLVGAFPGNVALFDRESATVDMALENEDDFVRNLVTFRCEERVALAVFTPSAFVKGTFAVTPPAVMRNEPAPAANKEKK